MEIESGGRQQPTQGFFRRNWNSWISLNVSWSSKWWYCTVQNVTAIVGSGVLGLPSAMAFLSWELGTMAIVAFIVLSLVCYWQIVVLHEIDGHRFDRYSDLGEHLLGKKLGFWMLIALQTIVEVGVDTVYIIIAASSMEKIYELLCNGNGGRGGCYDLRLSYWMSFFILIQLLLSQLPHIASLAWVSSLAAVTAVGYSTLAWIAVLLQPPVQTSHDYPQRGPAHLTFGVFSALGKIAFATGAGQNIAMEIQATVPSTPGRPSKVPMWRGVLLAYTLISLCYLPVALVGYAHFGNMPPGQCLGPNKDKLRDCHLLLVLSSPRWLIVLANLMVVIHMCGSYQVYAMPLFDNLENFIERKLQMKTTFLVTFFARTSYLTLTLLLAASFPFFGDLEAFLGGFAMIPATYLIPSILWHLHRRPQPLGLAWLGNMACICIGVLLTITSTTGGLRNLIVSGYEFFV